MINDKLSQEVIGCAFRVYNTLGFGFLESVYEKSMLIELQKNGLQVKSQEPIKVIYDEQIVGDFYADLLVENKLIIELKAASLIIPAHEVQLVNYLNATGFEYGLLINFGPKIDIKRKYRVLTKN
ncbi:MAG: GxxExxY protein [Lentisphaeraceae bacterium]|nr:GxxExxY protein [Lentisphaeraceae bacterium]